MIKRWLKLMMPFIAGIISGIWITVVKAAKVLDLLQRSARKDHLLCDMLSDWIMVKVDGKEIGHYLQDKGCREIAIYGMNDLGEILRKDLSQNGVTVKYAIDRNAMCIRTEIDVLLPEDELPDVDMIIVTAIAFFDEIEEKLSKKVKCPVVSLREIVKELL